MPLVLLCTALDYKVKYALICVYICHFSPSCKLNRPVHCKMADVSLSNAARQLAIILYFLHKLLNFI